MDSQIVYEKIYDIYCKTKKPVSLWQVYKACKKEGFTIWKIRFCIKWLFDNGFLKWENNDLVPLRTVEKK